MTKEIKGFDEVLHVKLIALSKWIGVTEKEAIRKAYEEHSDNDDFEDVYKLLAYKHPETKVRVAKVYTDSDIIIVDNISASFADTPDMELNDEIETVFEFFD